MVCMVYVQTYNTKHVYNITKQGQYKLYMKSRPCDSALFYKVDIPYESLVGSLRVCPLLLGWGM